MGSLIEKNIVVLSQNQKNRCLGLTTRATIRAALTFWSIKHFSECDGDLLDQNRRNVILILAVY